MSKFIFSLLLCLYSVLLFAQGDDVDSSAFPNPKLKYGHQLRIGFDASKLVVNQLVENKSAYEFAVDYYLQSEIYGVAEMGFGNSNIQYADLKYATNNSFLRVGFDKSLFARKRPQDWGLGFFGLRYGLALIQRGDAQYTTDDGLGGHTSGQIASDNFNAHWLELCGGMKVELFRGLFAGWTIRSKFLLNQKAFGDLKPAYISGYGAGEKLTAFDYNFYIAYAFRWASKKQ